jgi:hypothetical protein
MTASEKARYVVRFYPELMSPQERLAYRHLTAVFKAAEGRSDPDAQAEVRRAPIRSAWLTDDPAALELARDGLDAFLETTAARILRDSADRVFLNRCPKCAGLTRTPRARLCLHCGHSWHDPASSTGTR